MLTKVIKSSWESGEKAQVGLWLSASNMSMGMQTTVYILQTYKILKLTHTVPHGYSISIIQFRISISVK